MLEKDLAQKVNYKLEEERKARIRPAVEKETMKNCFFLINFEHLFY